MAFGVNSRTPLSPLENIWGFENKQVREYVRSGWESEICVSGSVCERKENTKLSGVGRLLCVYEDGYVCRHAWVSGDQAGWSRACMCVVSVYQESLLLLSRLVLRFASRHCLQAWHGMIRHDEAWSETKQRSGQRSSVCVCSVGISYRVFIY
jgi:hypothetical protein